MRDAESALSALGALRALGLHLAVDDFGTGYSSLAYLERLPVEALKIDRSFTEGVGVRKDSTAIVGAVVGLARALRLSTVAEGIETPEQFQQLRAWAARWARASCSGPPARPRCSAPIPAACSPRPASARSRTRPPIAADSPSPLDRFAAFRLLFALTRDPTGSVDRLPRIVPAPTPIGPPDQDGPAPVCGGSPCPPRC